MGAELDAGAVDAGSVNSKLEEKMTKAFNDVDSLGGAGRKRHAHRRTDAGRRQSRKRNKNTRTMAIATISF